MSASIVSVRGVLFILRRPRQFLALLGASLGMLLYVWVAAVRAVPDVRGRKAARRREWESSWRR
jgi:hypothetical protein